MISYTSSKAEQSRVGQVDTSGPMDVNNVSDSEKDIGMSIGSHRHPRRVKLSQKRREKSEACGSLELWRNLRRRKEARVREPIQVLGT